MDITVQKTRKIRKGLYGCQSCGENLRSGDADKIHQRIDEIDAADTVEMMISSISDDVIRLRRTGKDNTRWI